jgi:BirA family biotin operon repressor/biotin-[acetyl-CoA-carboxylase] ligase
MQIIGARIIELEETGSTNAYAGLLLQREQAEEGTVVTARNQTAGRGQGDNTWDSEAGMNLTFTVILYPAFLPPARQFLLNKAVSLGVYDFLHSHTEAVSIKWPNDLYLGGRKAGGILLQHRICGDAIEASLVGIGININQARFHPSLPDPVSLIHLLNREVVLEEALTQVLRFLDIRYRRLKDNPDQPPDDEYNQALMGFGIPRLYRSDNQTFQGIIRGVDAEGRLLVELPEGELQSFSHREIVFL